MSPFFLLDFPQLFTWWYSKTASFEKLVVSTGAVLGLAKAPKTLLIENFPNWNYFGSLAYKSLGTKCIKIKWIRICLILGKPKNFVSALVRVKCFPRLLNLPFEPRLVILLWYNRVRFQLPRFWDTTSIFYFLVTPEPSTSYWGKISLSAASTRRLISTTTDCYCSKSHKSWQTFVTLTFSLFWLFGQNVLLPFSFDLSHKKTIASHIFDIKCSAKILVFFQK